jgi:hypothetical protein
MSEASLALRESIMSETLGAGTLMKSDGRRLILPPVSLAFGADGNPVEVTARTPCYRLSSAQPVWIRYQFRGANGEGLEVPGYGRRYRMIAVEASGGSYCKQYHCDGTLGDGDGMDGMVDFPIEGTRSGPGIFRAAFGVMDDGNRCVLEGEGYLYIEKSLFEQGGSLGPPSISDLRIMLSDSMGVENALLDRLMWDDTQMARAVLQAIATWNLTPPVVVGRINSKTIPRLIRELILEGSAAYLLSMSSFDFMKNNVAGESGGMSMDDRDKVQGYDALAQRLIESYKATVRERKLVMSTRMCVGKTTSPFGWLEGQRPRGGWR